MMKRAFRNAAILSGLIEKPGGPTSRVRSGALMSTDLIYDVLRTHDQGHILLEAARADAAEGLLDLRRLAGALARFRGRIVHRRLSRVSPFSAPLMLEVGREPIGFGEAAEDILRNAEAEMIAEALRAGG